MCKNCESLFDYASHNVNVDTLFGRTPHMPPPHLTPSEFMSNVINFVHLSTSSRHSGHFFKPKIDPYSSLPPTYLECDCGFQIEHRIDDIKSAFLKFQPALNLAAFRLELGVHSYYWDTRILHLSNCPVSNGKVASWTAVGPSVPATPTTGVNSWGVAASNAPLMSVKHQGCECGAHKVMGATKGQIGHSSWCPWAAGNSHYWIVSKGTLTV